MYGEDKIAYKHYELAFIEGIQADRHSYLSHVFRRIKRGRKNLIAIFLDNLDRRDDVIQEEAFLRASAMARDWAGSIFVCLRPSTFYRSKQSGVLYWAAPKTISIVSPKTSVLLRKRFHYCAFIGGRHNTTGVHAWPALQRSSTRPAPVADFLNCCAESFRDPELVTLFSSVSNGNVRDLLRYVKQFITSQHLDTQKILDKIRHGYRIPPHEAQRALLFGDWLHYDPSRSIIVNVFDITKADRSEHLSRFLTLHFLNRINRSDTSRGFCAINDLEQYLCQLGFSGEHGRNTIEFLYNKHCCEGSIPGVEWDEIGDCVRITSLGRYHASHLVGTFQYLDAIIVDTPILDEELRARINDDRQIRSRLVRCREFIEYLDECSKLIQDSDAIQLWRDVYSSVADNIESIRRNV